MVKKKNNNNQGIWIMIGIIIAAVIISPNLGNTTTNNITNPQTINDLNEADCIIEETVTHGFVGSTDELLRTPVEILDFYQGSTYYYETSDFIIRTNSIDWSPNGAEPAPGSSYTIIYNSCN